MIWSRGLNAASISLQVTPSWEDLPEALQKDLNRLDEWNEVGNQHLLPGNTSRTRENGFKLCQGRWSLDIRKKFNLIKYSEALKQGSQGGGEVTVPGDVQETYRWDTSRHGGDGLTPRLNDLWCFYDLALNLIILMWAYFSSLSRSLWIASLFSVVLMWCCL